MRLDLNNLSIDESQELVGLIEASDFFNLPGNIASPDLATDEYHYSISVDTDGGSHHTVHTDDSSMPVSLRPLITVLSRLAFANPSEPK